MGQSSQQY